MGGIVQLILGPAGRWLRGGIVMTMFALLVAGFAAVTSSWGLTTNSLPVVLLFAAWLFVTYLALRFVVRSIRRQSSANPADGRRWGEATDHVAQVPPYRRIPAISLAERVQDLLPWMVTPLAMVPVAFLALMAGAVVADTFEAAGAPTSVTLPLGLAVAGVLLAACAIFVFRRLWSGSPTGRRRRAEAEALEQWLHDLDSGHAPPPAGVAGARPGRSPS